MKKGLLMTSALVAAGMLTLGDNAQAQTKPTNPVQLRVGGYMEELVGEALNRPKTHQTSSNIAGAVPAGIASAPNTFDQQTEAEIHFIGDGKLDNGLAIRAVAELEVSGSPGQVWDEAYVILRNGFGQLILGNEDPVAELMTAGYGNGLVAHAGIDMTYGTQSWVPTPPTISSSPTNSAARSAFIESPDNNDSNKIIYVSPRIFGFQVGGSYTPEERNQLDQGDGAGAAGTVDANKRLPLKDLLHDMWSAAANYEFAVSDMKFGLAAGYVNAAKPHMRFAANGAEANGSNAKEWGFGGRMDMGGFRFIVGYKRSVNIDNGPVGAVGQSTGVAPALFSTLSNAAPGGNNSADGYGVNAGAMYGWGPNAVSLNVRHGTEKGSQLANNHDSDKINTAIVSYARTLAPGVKTSINYIYQAYDDQASTDIDYHGSAIVGSFRLDF